MAGTRRWRWPLWFVVPRLPAGGAVSGAPPDRRSAAPAAAPQRRGRGASGEAVDGAREHGDTTQDASRRSRGQSGVGERGAVVVEYATVLALVVAAAALGLSGVTDAATAVLERQASCIAGVSQLTCPPAGASE